MRLFLSKLREAYTLIHHYPKLSLEAVDYDAYWRDKRGASLGAITPFQQARADWIVSRITPHSTVADYGSGDGGVLRYLRSKVPFTPIALDLSPVALESLQQQGIATVLIPRTQECAPESIPECDHLILFEVLEHMQNPESFLLNARKKVRKSIFFSFPNTGYLPYRLRLLLGRGVMQWRLHPGEHMRYWTVQDLHWWLQELKIDSRTEFALYEGLPLLNTLWGSLFAMGIVGEISTRENP